jgi:hypothetical protein
MDLIERTWEQLSEQLNGGKRIRATGFNLWLRTFPHERKTSGGIWLPPKKQAFHGELPHLVTTHALVLSAGPVGVAKEFKPGDVVAFKRLHFAFMWKLDPDPDREDCWGHDEEYVGWIDANQVLWKVEEEESDASRSDREAEGAADAAE